MLMEIIPYSTAHFKKLSFLTHNHAFKISRGFCSR